MSIDQFVGDRRLVNEDPEPAKGIDALVASHGAGGDARPADPVEPVAPGDEVAFDNM
jgi:hypothetical protein